MHSLSYGCKCVQRHRSVRFVGMFGRRAIPLARGDGDGIWVCMNHRGFFVIAVLPMARPDMDVLIRRQEEGLQQAKQRSCRNKTSDHGAIIYPSPGKSR